MSYIDKLKKMHNGKLTKSFYIHMKHGQYLPSEKEMAAKLFFKLIMGFPEDKKKAKELGLI